jgi:2-methylisocitrate lyase-like PEP mutase family enzyme
MAKERRGRRGFIQSAGLMAGGVLGAGLLPTPAAAQSGQTNPGASKSAMLRSMIAKGDVIVAPIVPDVTGARLCEVEGFPAIQIGDSQPTTWYGYPGYGLLSYTEVMNYSVHVASHTNLAVMTGMGDGGGTPLTIHRATQELERGGVAAVAFEDTTMETHFVRQGAVVSKQQWVDRIRAALDARKDPNFIIIARTDALEQGIPMEQAIERAAACAEAGADVIYFAGMKLEDYPKATAVIKKPLFHLGNATTTPAQAKAAKISFIAYHVDGVMHGALYQALRELKTTGKYENAAKNTVPREIQAKLTERDEYLARARKYNMAK